MTAGELLAESVAEAQGRERAAFEALSAQACGRIVLYGAGRLGRKVAAALRRSGIAPMAFADNDPRLDGGYVDGVQVLRPAAAAERWRGDALFVVTTFRPSGGGVQRRLDELAALGCRRTATFLQAGWRHDGVLPHFGNDLPSVLLRNGSELERAAGLWDDDASQETFRRELEWRLRAVPGGPGGPVPGQYFPRDILLPNTDEVFVDCGAYVGDTLSVAPWRLSRVVAVEPDPANAVRLRSAVGLQSSVHEVLLGDSKGSARFAGTGTMASARSDSGELNVPVTTVDDLVADERPTFIKIDVEGDELAVLRGARRTLSDFQPVVAICLYHRPEDLWTIPVFLREALPGHRFYLRAHAFDGFELVAYALPPFRCVSQQ